MRLTVVATFQTVQPLSQDTGLDLWQKGRFRAVTGKRTYELRSNGEAASLADAVTVDVRDVCTIVEDSGNTVHNIKVSVAPCLNG